MCVSSLINLKAHLECTTRLRSHWFQIHLLLLCWFGSLCAVGHVLGIVATCIWVRAGGAWWPSLLGTVGGRSRRPTLSRCCPTLRGTAVATCELAQQIKTGTGATAQLLESKYCGQNESNLCDDESFGCQQHQTAQEKWEQSKKLSADGQNEGTSNFLNLTATWTKYNESFRAINQGSLYLPSSKARANSWVVSSGNLTFNWCDPKKFAAESIARSSRRPVLSVDSVGSEAMISFSDIDLPDRTGADGSLENYKQNTNKSFSRKILSVML